MVFAFSMQKFFETSMDVYAKAFVNDLVGMGDQISKPTAMALWDSIKTENFATLKDRVDKIDEKERQETERSLRSQKEFFEEQKKRLEEEKAIFRKQMEKNKRIRLHAKKYLDDEKKRLDFQDAGELCCPAHYVTAPTAPKKSQRKQRLVSESDDVEEEPTQKRKQQLVSDDEEPTQKRKRPLVFESEDEGGTHEVETFDDDSGDD